MMRITSRVLVPGHGAELRKSAHDAPAEGTGLTSTDPAFFDTADLAEGSGFGNGIARADHGIPSGASRRIEGGYAVSSGEHDPIESKIASFGASDGD
ncbi:hypothetical protein EHI42_13005 [Rhizobium hidalgonense]|nr:hypothetical protein EHI42_13005 [Rhizobium hidalgonense]